MQQPARAWRGLPFLFIMASTVTHAFLLPHPTTPPTHPSTPLHAPSVVASPSFLPSCLPAAPSTSARILSPLHASTLEAPPSPSPPPTRRPPQRVFEAWTWRGHRINYRAEGDEKVRVAGGREGGIGGGWRESRRREEGRGEDGECRCASVILPHHCVLPSPVSILYRHIFRVNVFFLHQCSSLYHLPPSLLPSLYSTHRTRPFSLFTVSHKKRKKAKRVWHQKERV
jgi:hypothetical protein